MTKVHIDHIEIRRGPDDVTPLKAEYICVVLSNGDILTGVKSAQDRDVGISGFETTELRFNRLPVVDKRSVSA